MVPGPITVNTAEVPLNRTEVAPVKFTPVMVTAVPAPPEVGLKPVIPGAGGSTVKLLADVATPPGLVTDTEPEEAPAGTVAVICVADTRLNVAGVPLNATAVTKFRPLPFKVTTVPTTPDDGVNPVRLGTGITVKTVGLVAVPPAVVTLIAPLVAPAGTVAVSCVEETTE